MYTKKSGSKKGGLISNCGEIRISEAVIALQSLLLLPKIIPHELEINGPRSLTLFPLQRLSYTNSK